MTTPTPTTLLRTVERRAGETCTHPAIRSTGSGRWQCVLCQVQLTDLDLIEAKNERRAARWGSTGSPTEAENGQ